jgi:hypothetical protein
MVVNKKLWSLNFGCLIAGTFVWLASVGTSAPVLELFYTHPNFIIDYYSGLVTAILAIVSTLLIIVLMFRVFRICVSDHTFWLILPSLLFLILSLSAGQFMLLYAELPALFIIFMVAVIRRVPTYNKVLI